MSGIITMTPENLERFWLEKKDDKYLGLLLLI